jgi:hypothetical protein
MLFVDAMKGDQNSTIGYITKTDCNLAALNLPLHECIIIFAVVFTNSEMNCDTFMHTFIASHPFPFGVGRDHFFLSLRFLRTPFASSTIIKFLIHARIYLYVINVMTLFFLEERK